MAIASTKECKKIGNWHFAEAHYPAPIFNMVSNNNPEEQNEHSGLSQLGQGVTQPTRKLETFLVELKRRRGTGAPKKTTKAA